ncbi:MAG: pantoate--beta-alanine ligase [Patiriisocius sp.]|jgi:pantoate--beta-alanine ligase
MEVFTENLKLTNALGPYKNSKKIGLVPTMGALHQGHLSLVSQALNENDCVVVSIFVNPTQFGNEGDLINYPRTLHKDVALLKTLQGTIFVYTPEAKALYNNHVAAKTFNFGPIANEMEGKHRQGHFDGVGTVVSLLFKAVAPTAAYFGEKDFQQLQIVKKMVALEKLPVTIIGCSIVRETSGLAMSSRNKRLNTQELEAATIINKSLQMVAENFRKKSISELNTMVANCFKESRLTLEYFEIANEKTLKTVQRKRKGNTYRGFIAAFVGEIRLIDNYRLN